MGLFKNRRPKYTKTPYGLRYRPLGIGVDQGYEAATARLLPGESLYRLVVIRAQPELTPVLIPDEANFIQNAKRWKFYLVAGIPAKNKQTPR